MEVTVKQKLVAPDGGWSWAIAFAFILFFFLVFSTLAAFGLVFKGEFKKLNITGTESSFIFSANGGFQMLCGLVNGSLVNKYGTRVIGVWGAIFIITGLILTAFSYTFFHFFISYGVIAGLGTGMGASAFSVAINTYFDKKRNKVTGYAFALYGSGTILFPLLVSYLLANYMSRDTILIIAAIAANTMVAAVLLQPVERHMKVEEVLNANDGEETKEEDAFIDNQSNEERNLNPLYVDMALICASMTSVNLNLDKATNSSTAKESFSTRIQRVLVNMFDLGLLKDYQFVIILMGLAIEYAVEFNYLWIIPFILIENDLSVEQAATFMSIYAVADIVFRFLAPYIASWFNQSNRIMYMVSLVLVVTARTFLAILKDYIPLLFVGVAIGAFRGMRLVYWSLVIPEHIPSQRLASAFGISFTLNGIGMFTAAPILGQLRDVSGNYMSCVFFLNAISVTTVTMWTLELIYRKIRLRKEKKSEEIKICG